MGFRRSNADENLRSWDPFAHALTTISEEHRLIHDGMFFTARGIVPSIPAAGTFDILLKTGIIPPHFRKLVVTFDDGPVTIEFFEGTTVSADGVAASVINNNRMSSNVPLTGVFTGPTVTDPGTSLGALAEPGGPASAEGPEIGEELILASNTNYMVRITNGAAGAIQTSIKLGFYEISYRP